MKETELAARVVAHYADAFEVFKEVQSGGGIIDIVLRSGIVTTAIECKMGFGLDVIEQAHRNRGVCHFSYVAIPCGRNGWFKREVCKDYGIGVLSVSPHSIEESVTPRLFRKARGPKLEEYHKENEAGVQSGRITAFSNTVRKLVEVVRRNPGIAMKDAVTRIQHHYSKDANAAASLSVWVRQGVIKEVTIDRGKLSLSPSAPPLPHTHQ